FILNGDGIVAIDLDHCFTADRTALAPWALQIVNLFDTYAETSPSGAGAHLFLRSTLPVDNRKKKHIEVYSHTKALTVTGRLLPGHSAGMGIADRTEQLQRWYAEHFASRSTRKQHDGQDDIDIVLDMGVDEKLLRRLI